MIAGLNLGPGPVLFAAGAARAAAARDRLLEDKGVALLDVGRAGAVGRPGGGEKRVALRFDVPADDAARLLVDVAVEQLHVVEIVGPPVVAPVGDPKLDDVIDIVAVELRIAARPSPAWNRQRA